MQQGMRLMFRNTFKAALTASVALGGLACAAPVMAQTAGQQAQTVDDIVVTARRREESLQDTPLAIAAVTSEELKSARVERLADLAKIAPGLSFTPLFGAQNQLPIIRGAAQTYGQLNVGVFLDGVYLSGKAGVDIEMADLQRIEVVRGPQSALYGQNTFAGAINYISARPSSVLKGHIEGTVGDNGLHKLTASVSGPISDTLRFSVGAYGREFDGWYVSAIDGGKVDYSQTYGGMLTLDYQPTDRFSAILRLTASNEDSGQPASEVQRTNAYPLQVAGAPAGIIRNQLYVGEVQPLGRRINVNTKRTDSEVGDYGTRQDTFRASLDLNYDFGGVSLKSITAYAKRNAEFTYDGDNTICDRTGGCPNFGYPFAPGSLIPVGKSGFATSSADETYTDFSQELRLSSNGDGPLTWLVGAYYYDGESNVVQRSLAGLTATNAARFGYPNIVNTTKSWSVFGSATYAFTDKLSATLEARYQKEEQTYHQAPTNTAPTSPPPTASEQPSYAQFDLEKDFSFTTPRLIVDYKIEPGKMLYASIARGVKTGGFNPNINIFPDQRTFEPETSWNYEIGGKFDWMNHRLRTNVALFHTDWSDQQAACQNPASAFPPGSTSTQRTYTCNVAEAKVTGLEMDGHFRFNEHFSVVGSYAWTQARYQKFADASLDGTLASLGLPAWDFDGRHLPYVPDHKITLSPRFEMAAWGDYRFEGRLDVQYQSKTYVRADNMQYFGAKTTVDLRLALRSDALSYQFFVNNLLDDDTPTAAVRFYDSVNYSVASPLVTGADRRLIGVSVGYQF